MSRTAQFALFFAFATVVLTGIHAYLWLRLVRDTAMPPPWRQIATAALGALLVAIPVAMVSYRALPSGWVRIAGALPFVWMGVMMLLVFWFAATDAARLVAFAAAKIAGLSFPGERRLLVARAAAACGTGIVLCLSAFAIRNAARPPVLTAIELRLPRLPRALDGFTIVQISDLHIGASLNEGPWVRDLVDRVNALEPDLVAVTGDLVDGPPWDLRPTLEPLAGLRARRGVFFVTGNHEYYSGLGPWLPVLAGLGLRVLHNERVSVGDGEAAFDLVGVDDFDGRRMEEGHGPDLARATAGRDPSRFAVLLSHQPKIAGAAAKSGIDLVLAGHTHGGQIWPFSALVRLQQPYVRGSYRVSQGTQLFVTDGTGTWGPPMRLGTRNEIVRATLRAE